MIGIANSLSHGTLRLDGLNRFTAGIRTDENTTGRGRVWKFLCAEALLTLILSTPESNNIACMYIMHWGENISNAFFRFTAITPSPGTHYYTGNTCRNGAMSIIL